MKQTFIKSIVVVCLVLFSIAAHAHDFEVDGIYYWISSETDKTAEVTYNEAAVSGYYDSYSGTVIIPENVTYGGTTYRVTSISSNVFYGCSGITSISIPESITNVLDVSFSGCTGLPVIDGIRYAGFCAVALTDRDLASCEIKDGTKYICSSAFDNCRNLSSVTIPESVVGIGEYAFRNCPIKTISIPENVTSIARWTFYSCSELTSVNIPRNVTSIGYDAFGGCSSLTSIVIPDGVTSIKTETFKNCSSLSSITIPESVTDIASDAFQGCSSLPVTDGIRYADNCAVELIDNTLTSYTLKEGTKFILSSVFKGCTNLSSINIPNTVIKISDSAFSGCSNLTSVSIPNSVTSIGGSAFSGCTSLASLTIPNSVKTIGNGAFERCTSLVSLSIPYSVTEIGDYAFRRCTNLSSVSISTSLQSIGDDTFRYCSNLATISIPNSVSRIGNYAFSDCSSLSSVTLSNSLNNIGMYAFSNCSSLHAISIPNGVTEIKSSTFRGCINLTSVDIPSSVNKIGYSAFSNCEKLEEVYCYADVVPEMGENYYNKAQVFDNTPVSSCILYVPSNSIEDYKTAEQWKDFGTITFIPNTVIADNSSSFENTIQRNYSSISYTRNFTNTKWQSLYVPFTMRYEDWKDDYDVSFINSVRQYDNNNDGTIDETIMDVLQITGGELYPNMPYLIKAKTTGEKTIMLQNATLYPTEENSIDCSTMLSTFTFTGTYSTIPAATLEENGYYAMGGGGLIMTNGTSNLKPFRWYMGITSRSPMYNTSTDNPSRISVHVIGEEDDMETSLYGVAREEELDDQIFNFNGQMMDASEPLVPGFYIKNGKKVIIR